MNILQTNIKQKYAEPTMRLLHLSFPLLTQDELMRGVEYSIEKRFKDEKATVDNSYKDKQVDMTLLQLTEYILQREPIITPYGVMFKKHGEVKNPIGKLLQTFMEQRDKDKDLMFHYYDLKDMEMYERYNLFQLLDKIDANGAYGAMGQYSCLYYNLYVAASVTTQGRSCISAAGLLFESILANNVKFGSLNEVVTFIDNVMQEKSERKYNDSQILDKNITPVECFYKLMNTCGFDYIPTEKDMNIVWNMLHRIGQEDINRIYYKNNLFEFMENASMDRAIKYLLKGLKLPYLDPRMGKAPKEIAVELEEFKEIIKEYVYHHHQIIDRLDRYDNMIRKTCIITDTDSTIISLDGWYRFILEKVKDMDMSIKHELLDPISFLENDEYGDLEKIQPIEFIDDVEDYDFYNDEVVQMGKLINPTKIIPQEGVRYSIINILAYCLSDIILDYMERYTKHSNSYSDDRKCLIIMKNEFLFKRILLTDGKKNYASIQELKEGHIVNGDGLDIKGLPMTKSNINEKTQKELKKILYEDILNPEEINQVKLLKDLAILEKKIYDSLYLGKREFYKPVIIKSMSVYSDPMRIQGVKGAVVWNSIREENLPTIDLNERNGVDIVKVVMNTSSNEKIKDKYPEIYEKIKTLLENPIFKGTITAISLPRDIEEIPRWVIEFIDYQTIISNNCKNLPIESVGLYRGLDNNNYTNILSL